MTESQTAIQVRSVDIHAHVSDAAAVNEMAQIAPRFVPRLEEVDGQWFATFPNGLRRTVPTGLVEPRIRLAAMDTQGVHYQALACWTWLYLYEAPAALAAELIAIQNDSIVSLVRAHPGRFVALGGLPLQSPDLAIAEVERLAALREIVGVQIGTHVAGINLDDVPLRAVWAALERNRMPVVVHPDQLGNAGADRYPRYYLQNFIGNPLESTIAVGCLAFGGVFDAFPDLRWCFVHGGGFMPYQLGRWDHGWSVRDEAQIHLTRPPSAAIANCYFDNLTHDTNSLAFLGDRFGWSHILLGSDYPWDMAIASPIGDLQAVGVGDDTVDLVARRNALEFLRWPPSE